MDVRYKFYIIFWILEFIIYHLYFELAQQITIIFFVF